MNTKTKIINSALNLFVERGIDNTPTALITKNAGYSEATLFVNFKNKQGLIDAVYLDCKSRQKRAFSSISFIKSEAKQSLTNLYTTGVRYFIEFYSEAQFLDQVIDSVHVSSEAKNEMGKESEMFIDFFHAWRNQNIIKNIEFDFYEKVIWSAMYDMTAYCKTKKIKQIPKHLTCMLWDMLKQ